jgi:hypothetical protein
VYRVAVVGTTPTAYATAIACKAAGFLETKLFMTAEDEPHDLQTIHCLPASVTRILQTLCGGPLEDFGLCPDREQVRLGRSAYLLSELPLGAFYSERYGAPLINVTGEALLSLLNPTGALAERPEQRTLEEIEQSHEVSILCSAMESRDPAPEERAETFKVFKATTTEQHSLRNANVTWIGKGQVIIQRSTSSLTHYTLITTGDLPLRSSEWHESLTPAFADKQLHQIFSPNTHLIKYQFFEGRRAYLGDACYQPHPCFLESQNSGIEDAWVLSRMMENYEEDIGDGLREYERYRRPRAVKVANAAHQRLMGLCRRSSSSRFWGYINQALSTRFLPEIAMQKQDWFHQHNVIKGFR